MELALFLVAIAIAIAIGFFTKVNSGYVAIVFAVLLGVLVYGFSFNAVIGMWPVSLFLMLTFVMLFYGFAISNGTLSILAEQVTYAMRKVPYLLPIALWLFCLAVSAAGVGPIGVFAILAPTVMAIGMKAGMPRMLAAITVISGGSIGAMSPISTGGIVVANCAIANGYTDTMPIVLNTWLNLFIGQGLVFVLAYIIYKGWKLKGGEFSKPAPMDKRQKQTLGIIVAVLLLTFLPPILNAITHVAFFSAMSKVCNVTATCVFGVILCQILNVASEKDAFKTIPWKTIMLISGMCLLINTAVKYGLVDQLSAWITANIEGSLVIYLLIAIAALMSFVSSSLGVVVPTLSTLVPALVGVTGATPGLLYSAILVSAMLSGYSPFSTSGGITMSGLQDEGERKKLYAQLLVAAPLFVVGFAVLVLIGIVA